MHVILGASGQIGSELAQVLHTDYTTDIRVVSRNPIKINDTDTLYSADLMDPRQTLEATKGADTVWFTAGLPMDTSRWEKQWPVMMENVINACATNNARLVYFDNTYMYPQTSEPMDETTRFDPVGRKGRVRALITNMLLEAMQNGRVNAMICRAPEFYGPGKTQSITNTIVLDKLRNKQTANVFLSATTVRSLIYTPDASRAMALLGHTEDAYGQTWHLPCDDERLSYTQMIKIAGEILNTPCDFKVLKKWQLTLAGLVSKSVRETWELLPRYEVDNIFVSNKFKQRFPAFTVTPYKEGLSATLKQPTDNNGLNR
ncbi:NAD-dependent epimerase/dehydratase family protein [Salinimonas iocasae]|uniref:NAD-dependent epimerase/dehydratase family protein n=1 Tax=Salinimonas iocasae TaxID=2572577 RepID=A0A5B7YGC6_9ALTE|nr:NAD-dependent epimerase/dehydratase family protein [Salinimonas iocasae]QCZ94634.1 NAD-dependent epimerase/dehydratase family protein [Salinimonas iocasae]